MGAPLENQNAAKGKRWRDAIECAVEAWPDEPNYTECKPLLAGLRRAAHCFVKEMFETRNVAFFKEFGDRFDGKAAQSVTLDASVSVSKRAADMTDDELATLASNAGG